MENEKLVCPICGEPTRVYMGNARKDRLCGKHADMLKAGELILGDDGKFTTKDTLKAETVKEPSDKETDELTCIFCKKPSNGKHFCKACYYRYKDREMDIHIKNLTDWIITDEYGNQKIPCKSGMKVRSRAEKIIADFFFDHNIKFTYETDIPYRHNDKTIILNPDFYLPDHGTFDSKGKKRGLIIEYNELQNPTYIRTKNFTKESYEEMGFEVIVLTAEDINNDLLKLKVRLDII